MGFISKKSETKKIYYRSAPWSSNVRCAIDDLANIYIAHKNNYIEYNKDMVHNTSTGGRLIFTCEYECMTDLEAGSTVRSCWIGGC